jgi:hypothetical protein
MNKLPYAKFIFAFYIVALIVFVVAKFLTTSIFILVPLALGLYWMSVKSLAKINGYQ